MVGLADPRGPRGAPAPRGHWVGAGYALAPSAAGSRPICGSHDSLFGRYQFQSPSSFIVAGSSTARTSVASIRIAAARPTPIILNSSMLSVAKIANTATITAAALVTTPA